MNSPTTKQPEKPIAIDRAVVEAVAAKLKQQEAADKEAEVLADLAARDLLTAPAKFRYVGDAPRELGRELARWTTSFSRVKPPRTTEADYLTAGAVFALNVGDKDPVVSYPEFYVRLEGDEAEEAIPVQIALVLREAEVPVVHAKGVHDAAASDLSKKQAAVAAAAAAREVAEGVLAAAAKRHDAEVARFQGFVAGLGENGEAKARGVLASMAKPRIAEERPRAVLPEGTDPNEDWKERLKRRNGVEVVASVGGA